LLSYDDRGQLVGMEKEIKGSMFNVLLDDQNVRVT